MKQTEFPDEQTLLSMFPEVTELNVNTHIHTPYSFSSFSDIPSIFKMAAEENIACLGINDFFVTDGYESFHTEAGKTGVLPLFNIEFIGLLRSEQKDGIRINDPNNPGRCYFCGKGLDYPYHLGKNKAEKLGRIIELSQEQMKAMISKINLLFEEISLPLQLDYESVKKTYAKNLVRERHLAKAIRTAIHDYYREDKDQISALSLLFRKPVESAPGDIPSLENEIRSNLLKAGGRAFVEEDETTFMSLEEIIEIIEDAGGIPCYPVLLDDKKGNYTEFEKSFDKLYEELTKYNISCIELIPGRNEAAHLESFVSFFNLKGFLIVMGTEHNTPEMIPLTCDTRGKVPLSPEMKRISYEGACIIAAHQYLRSAGRNGYLLKILSAEERKHFIKLGNALIHFRNQNNHQQ